MQCTYIPNPLCAVVHQSAWTRDVSALHFRSYTFLCTFCAVLITLFLLNTFSLLVYVCIIFFTNSNNYILIGDINYLRKRELYLDNSVYLPDNIAKDKSTYCTTLYTCVPRTKTSIYCTRLAPIKVNPKRWNTCIQ